VFQNMPKWCPSPLKHTATFAIASVARIEAERLLIHDPNQDGPQKSRKDQYKKQAVFTTGFGIGEVAYWVFRNSGIGFVVDALRFLPGNIFHFLGGQWFTKWWYKNPEESTRDILLNKKIPYWKAPAMGCVAATCAANHAALAPMTGGWMHPGKLIAMIISPLLSWGYGKFSAAPETQCSPQATQDIDPETGLPESQWEIGLPLGLVLVSALMSVLTLILILVGCLMNFLMGDEDEEVHKDQFGNEFDIENPKIRVNVDRASVSLWNDEGLVDEIPEY